MRGKLLLFANCPNRGGFETLPTIISETQVTGMGCASFQGQTWEEAKCKSTHLFSSLTKTSVRHYSFDLWVCRTFIKAPFLFLDLNLVCVALSETMDQPNLTRVISMKKWIPQTR